MLHRTLRLACRVPAGKEQLSKSIPSQFLRSYTSPASVPPAALKKTPLHAFHVSAGAKMVPFAGYSMPVTYADQGLVESHNQVRTKAGLFDVSHMVQHRFKGAGVMGFLEHLTPSDLTLLKPHESTLSCFLHPITGGIVDDLIITMLSPDDFYVVTNAGCADKDLAYIREHLAGYPRRSEVKHIVLAGQGLIAVQGPQANVVVQDFLQRAMGDDAVDLTQVYFGRSVVVDTPTYGELHIARGGYTGEDGFEISIPAENTEAVTKELLEIGKQGDILRMAGLGARDTLRLEAGMCLYGHDLDDSTTPIEAGLKWLVAKRRVMEKNFHGAETIARQYNDAKQIPRRRIGLTVEKGAPARESAEIIDPASGDVLGSVTSGCPSPTLGTNIAIGYVRSGFHKSGTELAVKVRGKTRKATVTKMPFVKTNYYRAP